MGLLLTSKLVAWSDAGRELTIIGSMTSPLYAAGQDTIGEAVIVCKTQADVGHARALINANLNPVRPSPSLTYISVHILFATGIALHRPRAISKLRTSPQVLSCLGSPAHTNVLMRALLSGLVVGLIRSVGDAHRYIEHSLWGTQNRTPEAMAKTKGAVEAAVNRLLEDKFLEKGGEGMPAPCCPVRLTGSDGDKSPAFRDTLGYSYWALDAGESGVLRATNLGYGCVHSALPPEDSLLVLSDLEVWWLLNERKHACWQLPYHSRVKCLSNCSFSSSFIRMNAL
jgi:hypothetical protein